MKIPQEIHDCDKCLQVLHQEKSFPASKQLEKEEKLTREQALRELQIKAKEAKNKPLHMLRMPDVIHRTGLSRSTIYALMAEDKFPRQIKVSKNTAAWLEHEIDAYLKERIAERDATA